MDSSKNHYTAIIVGTGFASSFFLKEYLSRASRDVRVLVLEKGKDIPYSWKLGNVSNTSHNFSNDLHNLTPQKPWIQNIAFGGGSCWTGNTPRMHPSDFKTRTLHGVGEDWPFDYEELEPYLVEVEEIMGIAGADSTEYPRSRPYPTKPHRLNALDRLFQTKYGQQHMAMPSARASDVSVGRPPCCNNGVCSVCPIGAKFQVDLYMRSLYQDPRVTLVTEADVRAVIIESATAKGVHYIRGGKEQEAFADFVAVGAHAIATPFILLNSGLDDYALGRYLNEQISVDVRVNLSGVENYDGGQRVTGLGSMFVNEPTRGRIPGCLVENYNIPWLRAEFGKWRHVGLLKFVMEDIPEAENRVTVGPDGRMQVQYPGYSDYMQRGIKEVGRRVEALLDGLPVEDYRISEEEGNNLSGSAHIHGTTRMGLDPNNSVVDPQLIHHRVRNLAALGAGAFPTCPAANPTLILAALSLRSARMLLS